MMQSSIYVPTYTTSHHKYIPLPASYFSIGTGKVFASNVDIKTPNATLWVINNLKSIVEAYN
jgi:hypothetical protein